MTDEHKDAAVQEPKGSVGDGGSSEENRPHPAQSAPSSVRCSVCNGTGEASVDQAGVGDCPACFGQGTVLHPAQSAPISPRAALLEAARICEAAALNIGDKYYPTMNKNCAKALRALADTMPG